MKLSFIITPGIIEESKDIRKPTSLYDLAIKRARQARTQTPDIQIFKDKNGISAGFRDPVQAGRTLKTPGTIISIIQSKDKEMMYYVVALDSASQKNYYSIYYPNDPQKMINIAYTYKITYYQWDARANKYIKRDWKPKVKKQSQREKQEIFYQTRVYKEYALEADHAIAQLEQDYEKSWGEVQKNLERALSSNIEGIRGMTPSMFRDLWNRFAHKHYHNSASPIRTALVAQTIQFLSNKKDRSAEEEGRLSEYIDFYEEQVEENVSNLRYYLSYSSGVYSYLYQAIKFAAKYKIYSNKPESNQAQIAANVLIPLMIPHQDFLDPLHQYTPEEYTNYILTTISEHFLNLIGQATEENDDNTVEECIKTIRTHKSNSRLNHIEQSQSRTFGEDDGPYYKLLEDRFLSKKSTSL